MSEASSLPLPVQRLTGELAPFLAQHGLRAQWHPASSILRLEDPTRPTAPVAVTLDDTFVAKFDHASAEVQSSALRSIYTMVETRYHPQSKAQHALDIKPDPRCLDES